MTPEQRSAPENGIWLCQTCAKLVDADVERFSTAVLHAWKARAEIAAQQAMESGSDDVQRRSGITLRVTDWQMWRDRGTESDANFIIVSSWAAGDICFSCMLRFLNRGDCEEQLHAIRIIWQREGTTIYEDPVEVYSAITLPPAKWMNRQLVHGISCQKQMIYSQSDSIWLSAINASDGSSPSWKLGDIDHTKELRWA